MSKQKNKSKFKDEWLVNSKYKDWIKKVGYDVHSTYWSYCMKEISIARHGSKALGGPVRRKSIWKEFLLSHL